MNEKPNDAAEPAPSQPPSSEALLHRIVKAVEQDRRRGRLELVVAIILSVTTLATTWCGYQAKLWGNVQSTRQAAANTDERQAAENTIVGLQMRTFDLLEVKEYWAALRLKDAEAAKTIFSHMRPTLRAAVETSIAAGAMENPDVAGPLQRPEYVLAPEQDAQRLRDESGTLAAAAQAAGQQSGQYVLLTLSFASVLFFGGIAGTLTARRVRIGLACVALALFIATTIMLAGLPVCKG